MAVGEETMSEAEAMHELAKQLWERYFKQRVSDDLLNHSLDGYKATVITNNGDGTLTVRRPFDTVSMTLRCPPALAKKAETGDQVLVVSLGDMSNSFILCATDMEGFGSGDAGEKISLLDFSDIEELETFLVETESGVSETYTVTRDEYGRIITIEDEDGFETFVEWPEFALTPATEQQLAPVEWGTTASRAYAVGEYFCWNGLLYRVTSAISSGGTFTPGTNCEQVTVGAELTAIDSKMYQVTYQGNATYTYTLPAGRWFLIYANRANNSGTGLYAAHITGNNGFLTTIFETSGFSNLMVLTLSGRTLSIQVKSTYATLNILNFGGV